MTTKTEYPESHPTDQRLIGEIHKRGGREVLISTETWGADKPSSGHRQMRARYMTFTIPGHNRMVTLRESWFHNGEGWERIYSAWSADIDDGNRTDITLEDLMRTDCDLSKVRMVFKNEDGTETLWDPADTPEAGTPVDDDGGDDLEYVGLRLID